MRIHQVSWICWVFFGVIAVGITMPIWQKMFCLAFGILLCAIRRMRRVALAWIVACLIILPYPPTRTVWNNCLEIAYVARVVGTRAPDNWQIIGMISNQPPAVFSGYGEVPNSGDTYTVCGKWKDTEWQPWFAGAPLGVFSVRSIRFVRHNTSMSAFIVRVTHRASVFLQAGITNSIPGQTAGFISGLLWSGASGMDDRWRKMFRATGLSHVLAVSGYNVAVIHQALSRAIKFRSAILRNGIVFSALVFFGGMAGFGAPVLRSIMSAIVMIVARTFGRETSIQRVLLVSMCFLVLMCPYAARYDISMHLSFAATYGLIVWGKVCAEKIEKWFAKIPNVLGWQQQLGESIAASIPALPISAIRFGSFSILGPFATTALAWMIPYLMAAGAVCSILGHTFLSGIVGVPAWIGGNIFLSCVQWFSKIVSVGT